MAVKSRIISKLFLLCFFFNSFAVVKSWDQIDLELFDLVEELKENFYKILSVEQVRLYEIGFLNYRHVGKMYH